MIRKVLEFGYYGTMEKYSTSTQYVFVSQNGFGVEVMYDSLKPNKYTVSVLDINGYPCGIIGSSRYSNVNKNKVEELITEVYNHA